MTPKLTPKLTSIISREEGWGPLGLLEGQWVGARERNFGSGPPEQFYEVRTFNRTSVATISASNDRVFPVRFSWKLFHFYNQDSQVSEEIGYLLWIPARRQVIQMNIQATGLWKSEIGTLEIVGGECCLIVVPVDHGSIFESVCDAPAPCMRSIETTMFFNSTTLRYDHDCVLNAPEQIETTAREFGELIRVRN